MLGVFIYIEGNYLNYFYTLDGSYVSLVEFIFEEVLSLSFADYFF